MIIDLQKRFGAIRLEPQDENINSKIIATVITMFLRQNYTQLFHPNDSHALSDTENGTGKQPCISW